MLERERERGIVVVMSLLGVRVSLREIEGIYLRGVRRGLILLSNDKYYEV